MIPVILKGDTSAQIALSIGEGFPLSGCTLLADFCGIRREFHDVVSGGNVTLAFSADETACFPLGTSKVMFSMRNAAGDVRTFPWRKIKVTDSPADVCDAAITIDPATLEVETLPARFNDEDVRSRLDAVIRWLTRTASVVALLALPVFGATVDVQTAPKGRIFNDEQVVTNVVVDVSDLATTGAVAAAVATAREYTDAAMNALSRADATLTPVYSQTPTFGEWTFNRYNVALSEPLLTSEGLWGYHFSGDELNSDADQKFSSEAEALVATELTTATAYGITVTATRERTDIIGYRLGPDTSGNPNRDKPIAALDAVPPTVANIVRDLSLGGIWDEALQVWWTPRMRSGSLTYEATTNVNLNAEN